MSAPESMQGSDIEDHLEHFDALETVTLTQTATMTENVVEHALRRPLSLRELEAFAGTFSRGDMKFHIPQAETSFIPAPGDTITDAAAVEWTIVEVELLALGTRYRCWCEPS